VAERDDGGERDGDGGSEQRDFDFFLEGHDLSPMLTVTFREPLNVVILIGRRPPQVAPKVLTDTAESAVE
jgi:hypothetical protein